MNLSNIQSQDQITQDIEVLLQRFDRAKTRRQNWEGHWQECYDYALPQRGGITRYNEAGASRVQSLYDGTAMDSVDQLAASLLANLTPPWSQWFGFKLGPELGEQEAKNLSPVLEGIAKKIQSHLDRSNFTVEMHQCFLDLAVGGTATLYFEETDPGSFSAFKFSAVPLQDIVLEEGENGFLDGSFRSLHLTLAQLKNRYPQAILPAEVIHEGEKDPQSRFDVIESVLPTSGTYEFMAVLSGLSYPVLLAKGKFNHSPAISFRWMKSPGEIYGRSPVMKALPDIKTANKVVELILKNASIAATGIWQADDDGVLNPANIELVPGAIIPKAVGSEGLKPLNMPGRFDVSELVLKDLRSRIRHALLTDKLGPVVDRKMTATEVLERSSEMAMLLGATYGRLQSELLTPLIQRAFAILRRRGEIPDLTLDGRYIALDYRSPLAQAQGQRNVQNVITWLNTLSSMGVEASHSIDVPKTAQFIGQALGVPADLMRDALASAVIPKKLIAGDENV